MPNEDLRAARGGYYLGALDGLVASAEHLLGEAARRAPIEEGTLRASGALTIIVNGTRYEGTGAHALARAAVSALARAGATCVLDTEISFNTVYAARQHEELDWRHPLGGEAKYLERPLLENAGRYEKVIGQAAARGATRGA